MFLSMLMQGVPPQIPTDIGEYGLLGLVLFFTFSLMTWLVFRGVKSITETMQKIDQSISGTIKEMSERHRQERREWLAQSKAERDKYESKLENIVSELTKERRETKEEMRNAKEEIQQTKHEIQKINDKLKYGQYPFQAPDN